MSAQSDATEALLLARKNEDSIRVLALAVLFAEIGEHTLNRKQSYEDAMVNPKDLRLWMADILEIVAGRPVTGRSEFP